MKTISIRKSTKCRLLERVGDDCRTMDRVVNKLLDDNLELLGATADELELTRANIHISEETLERLKSFRIHQNETYNEILCRLLDSS